MLKFAIALGIISVTAGAVSSAFAELPTVAPPHDSVMKKELDANSFVQQAALNSMQEIELSKLVLDKSQNDRLREFATTIIANSTASLAGLRAIANYNKIGMPERLDAERRQLIDQTRQLRDRGFDETYVNLIQKVHDTTVGLYSNAEGQANFHSELKSFAKRQLPTLQEDQRKAHALFPTSPTSAIPPSQ